MAAVVESPWEIALAAFPADGRFDSAGGWLRGRVSGTTCASLVDVRAWVGRELAVGYIESVTVDLNSECGSAAVDFVILVQPPEGRSRFKLEFFEALHDRWREGLRREIEGRALAGPAKSQFPVSRETGWMLLRTLRNQQAQPRYSWQKQAQALTESATASGPRIDPCAPLYGCLEEPGELVRTNHGLLAVNGWVAHANRAIVRVTAHVDPRLPTRLNFGAPRRDVAAAFGHLCDPLHSHFSGEVVVPPSQPEPWGLVIVVELADGERVLAFARRVGGPAFAVDLPGQLPPYSARRLVAAATTVLAARGWQELPQVLRDCAVAGRTYRRHASPRVIPGEIEYHSAIDSAISPRRFSVVIVNDNFTLGGAALFAFEYALFLKRQLGWSVRLASPVDGPLRKLCDDAGIAVQLIDAAGVAVDSHGGDFNPRIASLAAAVGWGELDLVVANTLVVFWAVPLACACGKPSVFYIHESARLEALFAPTLIPFVQAAISGATQTVFLTEWTRSLHRRWEQRGNFRLMRSWVNLAQLDAFSAANDRRVLRERAGIPASAIVMICLGSICDRKGQRGLVRAIDYLVRMVLPAQRDHALLQVLLVGARPSPDVDQLKQDIALRELGAVIRLIDETPDALCFLRLADIYVCPSFEEGFPRALMEAAAFGLPIVTTNVCGIPELLRESEAWLVPPGEPTKLADALNAAMHAHRAGDMTRPRKARARIERLFNAAEVLPQHAALLCETITRITPLSCVPLHWVGRFFGRGAITPQGMPARPEPAG